MERNPIREGTMAGILGASSVAVWFLLIDTIAGRPFYTPAVLGESLLSVLGPGATSTVLSVAAYTVFHFAAFIAIGIIVAVVLRASVRSPAALAGFLILFVAFEIGFYGITALFAQGTRFGGIAWYQAGIANLIAAVVMGRYFWRAHPAVGANLKTVLEGGE
jgi:hypothetical protein